MYLSWIVLDIYNDMGSRNQLTPISKYGLMRRWNLAIDGACVSRHVEVASYLSKLEAVRTHVEVI